MSLHNQRLQRVFREVFEDDDLVLTSDLSQRTLPKWDSFAQVKLIIGIEEEFNIKFTTDEVATVSSLAGIRAILESRVDQNS